MSSITIQQSQIGGTPQVDTIQELSNVNNAEGVKQNTKSSTSIHKFFQTSSPRSFSKAQNTKPRNIQDALANSYGLSKTDAQNIESSVNALQNNLDSISPRQAGKWQMGMKLQENIGTTVESLNAAHKLKDEIKNLKDENNIKNNFFTKLKKALAKVANFFGDSSKLEIFNKIENNEKILKLANNQGREQFNDIKILLTEDDKGREFLASFIEKNAGNNEVMDGLCKMLGENLKSKILDGSLKIKNKNFFLNESFIKSIDFNNKQEVEGFVKACMWADQQMIQESLGKNLKVGNKEIFTADHFGQNNQIFADVERGYSFTFTIEGKKISLEKTLINEGEGQHFKSNREQIYQNLNKQFDDLRLISDQKLKIKRFCSNFATQGCLALNFENSPFFIPIKGNGMPTFNVNFLDDKIEITCTTTGESEAGSFFSEVTGRLYPTREMEKAAKTDQALAEKIENNKTFAKKINDCMINYKVMENTTCSFSFLYNLENGSAENIQFGKEGYKQNISLVERKK